MGGETEVRGGSRAKRWLIWRALILAGLGGLAALLLFTWPQESRERTRFDMGSVDAYSVGSVTTVEEGAFHLVRLNDETFIALSWTDSHFRRCTVPWKPDFVWPDPDTGQPKEGWFRDPCAGSTYDKEGHRVFGPASRDLDRYVVSIADDRVFVNTGRFVGGFKPPSAACVPPAPSP